MTTYVPRSLDSPCSRFLVHHFPGSSHVYPPSSWLDLDSVVFIYPHLPSTLPLASRLFPPSAISLTPQSLSHTFTLASPLRSLTQERHYSLNSIIMISPPCLLPSPLPSGSCVCDMAIREQTGTGFFVRYAPSLLISQSCISTWDCLLLSFLLSAKAVHKRRAFWMFPRRVYLDTWGRQIVKRSNTQLGLTTFLDAMDVYIRFGYSSFPT